MSELARIDPTSEVVSTNSQDPTGGRLVAWADGLAAAHRIGSALCRTSFVPRHFQDKPEEAAAAILFGDEIGFTPTQALRSIYVISGAPALYARAMVALVQSHGHEVWTETDTSTKVTVAGRRRGTEHVERSEWTLERARRAGYTNNKKYETDPQAMLYARSASDVCRKVAADALAGVAYSVEELELGNSEGDTGTRTTRRTVKRADPAPAIEPPLDDQQQAEQPSEQRQEPEPDFEQAAEPEQDTQQPDGESPLLDTSSKLAKRMFGMLGEAGITDKNARLLYVSRAVGREVSTSREMTDDDATEVINALAADLEAKDREQGQADEA